MIGVFLHYAKAVTALVVPGAGVIAAALADGHISGTDWITITGVIVGALGVAAVPNSLSTRSRLGDTNMSVKETKDALHGLIALGVAARDVGKDGWTISDAGLLIKNDMLQAAVATALEGAENIPYELSHLSFSDTLDLVQSLAEAAKLFEPKS